jgi:Ca2+-binding EF-hand superfamily protein
MTRLQICAAALLAAALPASAAMDAKMALDTNQDGMVSKDEFIKYHEAAFDRMDKGGKGMVPVADVERSMRGEAMRGNRSSREERATMDDRARKGQAPTAPAPAQK